MIGKLLRWGNSYGIRLSRKEIERLGAREGDELVVEVKVRPTDRVDLSHLRTFTGGPILSQTHDQVDWS